MATRNFVPRADNEGGIGTALKRWATAYIVKITANNVIISDGAGNYMQLPKLTTAERDALSAVNGMVIYNTTTFSIQSYENGAWGAMAGGENNTASNVGTAGIGIFKQKTGVDLEFKNINAGSSKITITDDVANNEVDIDVDPTKILTANSVTATIITASAVTTAKINTGAVTNVKIAATAVTAAKIAPNAITTTKIAASAVTTAKIKAANVTTTSLAASAVTTAKINTGAVTNTKIAATAVTAAKVAPNAITTTKIAASAVTTAKIKAANVTTTSLAASAVTTVKINTGAVTNAKIAATAVTAAKIAPSAVTTTKIAASAVTTSKINTAAVTYAKMQNVSATDKLLGRSSAGAGVIEEIACTAAGRALLDDANVAAQITTLGLDNAKTVNQMLWAESAYLPEADFSLTGTVTMTNGSTAVTGSGTAFDTELQVNDYIKLDADSSTSWAKVASIESATALTLSANYSGTGGASAGSGSGNPVDLSEIIGSGRYMGWSVLKFDDTLLNPDGGERCGWRIPMPDYDGGNIILKGFAKPATTPAGAVTFVLNIKTIGLATSEGFDKAVTTDTGINLSFSLNTTELSTDVVIATATIDPTNVAADDLMVLELDRDVASDNLSGDGQLIGILIKYTRA